MQIPSISAIFDKREDGKYTDDALLYQYILKYPISGKERSTNSNEDGIMDIQVSLWDMIKWLIRTLPEFKRKYPNNIISNTIPKIRRRIKGKLDDLVYLQLLQSEKKKQKMGDGTTDCFRYTVHGQVLGWIIESIDLDNKIVDPENINYNTHRRENIDKQIYNSLQQIFKTGKYSPTINILASKFIGKCMHRRLFGNIVSLFKNALNDQEILIEDMSDLLHNLTMCNFKEQNTKVIFSRLWDETIMELEPEIQYLVLYDLKLSLERDIEDHVKAYQSYEKMWFQFKSDYKRVVVECNCTNCVYYTPVAIDLMEYRQRSLYPKIDLSNLTPLCLSYYKNRLYANDDPCELSIACQACRADNSLRLTFFD
jgi:hypothetical protein